ncbi:tetratricopeptide repeat protein [Actinokineospora sp. 24-640]
MSMMIKRAEMLGEQIMTRTSLKTKLSRWENGHEPVTGDIYRRLFRDIYGRTNEELGFPSEAQDEEAVELRARLAAARIIDPATVDIFRRQVDQTRHMDRRFGGITLLDQLRSQIDQVETFLRYSTEQRHREELASVMVEASTLAGWESLDRNAITQAWNHYQRAKAAAREAGSLPLLAHATAEQAFVLIDLGETALALDQLAQARSLADDTATPLLRAWLAAAHGEGYAANGRRDEAMQAFDDADALLPEDPTDPSLPYVFLGGSHLARWRGNALATVGDPEAISHLTGALPVLPREFIRARVGMLVDLAFAHSAAGERDAAHSYTQQARKLGQQIRSDRHIRRLGRLILPNSSSHSA